MVTINTPLDESLDISPRRYHDLTTPKDEVGVYKGVSLYRSSKLDVILGGTNEQNYSICGKKIPADATIRRNGRYRLAGEPVWRTLPSYKQRRVNSATAICVREDTAIFVVIGGMTKGDAHNTAEVYELRLQTTKSAASCWRGVPPLHHPLHSASAAFLGDYLYVVGGRIGPNSGGHIQKEIIRIRAFSGNSDGTSKTVIGMSGWEVVSELRVAAYFPSLAQYGPYLYIVGGGQGSKSLRDVSVLDTETLKLYQLPSLKEAREASNISFTEMGIFVYGGYNEGMKKNSIELLEWANPTEWKIVNLQSDVLSEMEKKQFTFLRSDNFAVSSELELDKLHHLDTVKNNILKCELVLPVASTPVATPVYHGNAGSSRNGPILKKKVDTATPVPTRAKSGLSFFNRKVKVQPTPKSQAGEQQTLSTTTTAPECNDNNNSSNPSVQASPDMETTDSMTRHVCPDDSDVPTIPSIKLAQSQVKPKELHEGMNLSSSATNGRRELSPKARDYLKAASSRGSGVPVIQLPDDYSVEMDERIKKFKKNREHLPEQSSNPPKYSSTPAQVTDTDFLGAEKEVKLFERDNEVQIEVIGDDITPMNGGDADGIELPSESLEAMLEEIDNYVCQNLHETTVSCPSETVTLTVTSSCSDEDLSFMDPLEDSDCDIAIDGTIDPHNVKYDIKAVKELVGDELNSHELTTLLKSLHNNGWEYKKRKNKSFWTKESFLKLYGCKETDHHGAGLDSDDYYLYSSGNNDPINFYFF